MFLNTNVPCSFRHDGTRSVHAKLVENFHGASLIIIIWASKPQIIPNCFIQKDRLLWHMQNPKVTRNKDMSWIKARKHWVVAFPLPGLPTTAIILPCCTDMLTFAKSTCSPNPKLKESKKIGTLSVWKAGLASPIFEPGTWIWVCFVISRRLRLMRFLSDPSASSSIQRGPSMHWCQDLDASLP